jgi:hypothetical protein
MKLGKKFGRIGFVIGFAGPFLFYASLPRFSPYESHFICPWCSYVDIAFANTLTWVGVGLRVGLFCGLLLAFVGFSIGYMSTRLAQRLPSDWNLKT